MAEESANLVEQIRQLMERRQALLATPGPDLDRAEAELAAACRVLKEQQQRTGAGVLKG
jgi:hypothetical protein